MLKTHIHNIVTALRNNCESGQYDQLVSSDKGTDNQGHSFEDKVLELFTNEFGLQRMNGLTLKEKQKLVGDYGTTKSILYQGKCSKGKKVLLVRSSKKVDFVLYYEGKYLPIELKSANGDYPKFNAGLNQGEQVRKEVIIFHARKSRYITVVSGEELLPKAATDAFEEARRRIRVAQQQAERDLAIPLSGFKLEYPQRQELTQSKRSLFAKNPQVLARGVAFMCKAFE